MKNIALFGGSFDPPHTDHYRILDHLVYDTIKVDGEALYFNEVWVTPVSEHAFDEKKPLPYEKRKPLVEAMIQEVGKLMHRKIKCVKQDEAYTADFLERLHKENPDTRFYLVVGADVLHDTGRWHRWEDITKKATVLPFVRKGFEVPDTWGGLDPVQFESKGISSTEVREKLAKADHRHLVGTPLARSHYPGMISEKVFNLIRGTHGREPLYGYEYKSDVEPEVKVRTENFDMDALITSMGAVLDAGADDGISIVLTGPVSRMVGVQESPDKQVKITYMTDKALVQRGMDEVLAWENRRTNAWSDGKDEAEWQAINPEPKLTGPGFVLVEEGTSYKRLPTLGAHLGYAHGYHFFEAARTAGTAGSFMGSLGGVLGGMFR